MANWTDPEGERSITRQYFTAAAGSVRNIFNATVNDLLAFQQQWALLAQALSNAQLTSTHMGQVYVWNESASLRSGYE